MAASAHNTSLGRAPGLAPGASQSYLSGQGFGTPGLLVMDVDSTLINEEVIELLADAAGQRAEVAAVTERAMRGELDFAASLRERVATLAGLPMTTLADVAGQVTLTPGAGELVEAMHARGCPVGVVSGGFMEVLEPLAKELSLDFWAANHLEIVHEQLSGRIRGDIVDAAAKEHYLRQWASNLGVPVARTIAMGDGANDLKMVRAAGLGVAFCAKPIVIEAADAAIGERDLRLLLELL